MFELGSKWLTQHPYGYRLVNKTLEIQGDEAAIVHRIYGMYVKDGRGFFAIAKQLNAEGIPSRFNKEWSIQGVKNLLTNPVYKGTLMWNRMDSSKKRRKLKEPGDWIELPNAVASIVEEELWNRAQERVQKGKQTAPRAASSPHLLSGLLKCGKCGAAMSIGWSGYPKRNRVYRCSAYSNKGTCQSKPYRADKVEEWFLEALHRLIDPLDGAVHQVVIERVQQEQSAKHDDKVRVARNRYARQVEAYTAGLIEMAVLADEKETLDATIREAEVVAQEDTREGIEYRELEAELRIPETLGRAIRKVLDPQSGKSWTLIPKTFGPLFRKVLDR